VFRGVQVLFANKMFIPCVRFQPTFQYVSTSIESHCFILRANPSGGEELLDAHGRKNVTKIIIAPLTALRGVSKRLIVWKAFFEKFNKLKFELLIRRYSYRIASPSTSAV
jgi:hypothetical protein